MIDHEKVAADLSGFPVLINLVSDADLAANAQADFDDILFTSSTGTHKLSHEIEKFSKDTGELVAWVKADLADAANTDLYMYFGNAAAGSQENAQDVWSNAYVGVWHFPDGTTLSANDSTSNGNHGVVSVQTASPGKMDGAACFPSGVTSKIDVAQSTVYDFSGTDPFTVEVWINPTALGSWQECVQKSERIQYALRAFDTRLNFILNNDNTQSVMWTGLVNEVWQYAVGTADGSKLRLYYNGEYKNSAGHTNISNTGKNLRFGGLNTSEPFKGSLDEARISNIARSQEWISTQYNNQSSPYTFYALGEEERPTPRGTVVTVR